MLSTGRGRVVRSSDNALYLESKACAAHMRMKELASTALLVVVAANRAKRARVHISAFNSIMLLCMHVGLTFDSV